MSVALQPVGARRIALACLELTKPRIATLVVITGVPALLLAADGLPPARIFWGALLGTLFAAGSAASFNMYVDRDIDGLMRRTASRPLPAGTLPPAAALVLGFALAAASLATLAATTNLLAAALGLASILYYAVIYTVLLKRRTPQNIVIGGGAGASAPLIAWAAVTGEVGLAAVLLAAIVFFWTPPHFWALALYRRDDYERAGIPMLPVTHGEPATRRWILGYTVLLVPITLAVWPLGVTGALYGVPALLLGAAFIGLAMRLVRHPEVANAVGLFRFSILYLFALFALMTADVVARSVLGA
uniref:Protoheme IX farnesyltransferase n=1 Tax=Eiseniibacteriota bacterium TaxID=2212470 RepID=A0A832I4M1_UNCEI